MLRRSTSVRDPKGKDPKRTIQDKDRHKYQQMLKPYIDLIIDYLKEIALYNENKIYVYLDTGSRFFYERELQLIHSQVIYVEEDIPFDQLNFKELLTYPVAWLRLVHKHKLYYIDTKNDVIKDLEQSKANLKKFDKTFRELAKKNRQLTHNNLVAAEAITGYRPPDILAKRMAEIFDNEEIIRLFRRKIEAWSPQSTDEAIISGEEFINFFFRPIRLSKAWTRFWDTQKAQCKDLKQAEQVYRAITGGFTYRLLGAWTKSNLDTHIVTLESHQQEMLMTKICNICTADELTVFCENKLNKDCDKYYNDLIHSPFADLLANGEEFVAKNLRAHMNETMSDDITANVSMSMNLSRSNRPSNLFASTDPSSPYIQLEDPRLHKRTLTAIPQLRPPLSVTSMSTSLSSNVPQQTEQNQTAQSSPSGSGSYTVMRQRLSSPRPAPHEQTTTTTTTTTSLSLNLAKTAEQNRRVSPAPSPHNLVSTSAPTTQRSSFNEDKERDKLKTVINPKIRTVSMTEDSDPYSVRIVPDHSKQVPHGSMAFTLFVIPNKTVSTEAHASPTSSRRNSPGLAMRNEDKH